MVAYWSNKSTILLFGGLKTDQSETIGNKRVFKFYIPKGSEQEKIEDTGIMLPKNVLTICPAFVDETNILLINENPEMEFPEVIPFSIEKFLSGG